MSIIKKLFLSGAVASTICLASCDKGFESVNTSPDLVQDPNLSYTLPFIQLSMLDNTYYTNFTYLGQFMSHVSSYGQQFDGLTTQGGGDYHFSFQYGTPIKNVVDFLSKTTSPDLINYHAMGRIMKAYCFSTLTDVYGDIPYFNAGKGYLEQVNEPAYDSQQEIYADLFKELSEAASSFDAAQKLPGSSDIIYKGDITKWKKFAYSLMLRFALRIYNKDAQTATTWINAAIDGGLMQNNDDNAVVLYKPNTYYATISNGQCTPFAYYPTWKLAEPFVAFLRDNHDPRLKAYSVLPDGDTTASAQVGLPPFTPANAVPMALPQYSISRPTTFAKYDAPFMHMSYSQVELMLSECIVRGIITGDAKLNYDNWVTAAMKELSLYGTDAVISDQEIQQYLADHPFNNSTKEQALEMINNQYWLETHYNWYETFANWRRSGYPLLDESKFTIPRRLTYPVSEVNVNRVNVEKANERQGPDAVSTRVWWDKE